MNHSQATEVKAAGIVFKRRSVGPEEGAQQLRVTPLKPVEELRKTALASQPPKESGEFRTPDLVEITSLDSTIKLDIRYATTNNFLGSVFYTSAHAFMRRPAAEALARASKKLQSPGYGLLIHDAYRPWYVTKIFWDATPDDKKVFVADPSRGSRHNRGAAVDLTLYDLKTGKPVEMVGTYDERIVPIRTIRAERRCSAGIESSCVTRWSRKASPSTRPNGGTSTSKTGRSTPSATRPSKTSCARLSPGEMESRVDDKSFREPHRVL